MWFSVLKQEAIGYNAGTIFVVRKHGGQVEARKAVFGPDEYVSTEDFMILCSKEQAREYLTKPTRHLSDAIEHSIMISEQVYC